jgi:hypothetical protein
MGQFKPMVKMMTTEPSVELKLKKGGSVKSMTKMKSGGDATDHKKMASGGAMAALSGTPALVGRPAVNAPVRSPGKPSMASRRKAMAAKPKAMPATPMMKKGGSTKKLEKEIRNESEEIGRVKAKLTKHEDMAASKAHKGLKTGGVALGNGGGYKKGGAAKKYAEGGAVNDSGKAEKMPQGHKKPSAPVSITALSGTFKKGGEVKKMTPAEKRLTKMFDKENAPALKAAKSKDVEIYSKYGKAMRSGGKC